MRWYGWACLVLILLLVLHPWILELPGRIASFRFGRGLHVGMTRAQVQALEDHIESLKAQQELNFGPDYPNDVTFATWQHSVWRSAINMSYIMIGMEF